MPSESRFPATVLANYPQIDLTGIESRESGGGFSGASVWKIDSNIGIWSLKAWPPGGLARERILRIHGWMMHAREAELRFVPSVARTSDGSTLVEQNGRICELVEWMPGTADFHVRPEAVRLQAACNALARLHRTWQQSERILGEPPSLLRRLRIANDWTDWIASGWKPRFVSSSDPISDVARIAWEILPSLVPTVLPMLAPWIGKQFSLHPCLCDLWHDHVLYMADEVTGIIDYGSMRLDHPATDLARLLGDLCGRDESLYDAGLTAYRQILPLSLDEMELIRALDRTGTILAVGNWLRRLYRDEEPFADRHRVAHRLRTIVERLSGSGERSAFRLC